MVIGLAQGFGFERRVKGSPIFETEKQTYPITVLIDQKRLSRQSEHILVNTISRTRLRLKLNDQRKFMTLVVALGRESKDLCKVYC